MVNEEAKYYTIVLTCYFRLCHLCFCYSCPCPLLLCLSLCLCFYY